jgi:hypothetical protein
MPTFSNMTTAGYGPQGDIVFPPETYPYCVTDVVFLQQYVRGSGASAYAPNWGPISPPLDPINGSQVTYGPSNIQGTRLGVNEAAALVAAGVARYA